MELAPLPYSTQIDPPPIVMLSGALLPMGAVAKVCSPSTIGVLPISVFMSASYIPEMLCRFRCAGVASTLAYEIIIMAAGRACRRTVNLGAN
jgi:hypothetical protein